MSARSFNAPEYKYGFNGKENDNETVGTGSGTQDYGMRIYNPALGRFLSVDPLTPKYPNLTPYQFASNSPIAGVDLDGLEFDWYMNLMMAYYKAKSWFNENGELLKDGLNDIGQGTSKKNPTYDNAGIPKSTQKILNAQQISNGTVKVLQSASNTVHATLDMMGFIPVAGDALDLVNAGLYAAEGKTGMATVSAISVIPIVGDLAKGSKWAIKGSGYSAEVSDWGIGTLEAIYKDAKGGPEIGVWATKEVSENGKVLTLSDISIYSTAETGNKLKNKISSKTILEYRRGLEQWAKEQGYDKVIFSGKRTITENGTSAKPGKNVSVEVDLK